MDDTLGNLIEKDSKDISKSIIKGKRSSAFSVKKSVETAVDTTNNNSSIIRKNKVSSIFSSQKKQITSNKVDKENDIDPDVLKGNTSVLKILTNAISNQSFNKGKEKFTLKIKKIYNLKGRIYNKLINLEDSISEGNSDYDYFDYVPRWYSIMTHSSFKKYENILYSVLLTLSLFFYPLELVYFTKSSPYVIFWHLLFETNFFLHFLFTLFEGFKSYDIESSKGTNYKLTTNLLNYIKNTNLALVFIHLTLILYNYPLIIIIRYLFNIQSYSSLRDSLIISKFFLFCFLFDWININSILKTNNDLHFNKGAKSTFINWSIVNDIINGVKIFIYYVIFIHIASSIWIHIEYDNDESLIHPDSWAFNYKFANKSFHELYVASFYFCLTSFLSVGYGDIVPISISERVFVCFFFWLLALLFLSYFNILPLLEK